MRSTKEVVQSIQASADLYLEQTSKRLLGNSTPPLNLQSEEGCRQAFKSGLFVDLSNPIYHRIAETQRTSSNCRVCDEQFSSKRKRLENCAFCGYLVCQTCLPKKRIDPESESQFVGICLCCQKQVLKLFSFELQLKKERSYRQLFEQLEAKRNSLKLLFSGLKQTRQLLSKELKTKAPITEKKCKVEQLKKQLERQLLQTKELKAKTKEKGDYCKVLQNSIDSIKRQVQSKKGSLQCQQSRQSSKASVNSQQFQEERRVASSLSQSEIIGQPQVLKNSKRRSVMLNEERRSVVSVKVAGLGESVAETSRHEHYQQQQYEERRSCNYCAMF